MSFILDALKKSEAERQRQAGPALLEMRIVRPARRLPPWAIVVGTLLVGCVLALAWVALRRGGAGGAATPVTTAAVSPVSAVGAPAVAPAGASAGMAANAPAAAGNPGAAVPASGPPVAGAASAPAGATVAAATAATGAQLTASGGEDNPADIEPAEAPSASAAQQRAETRELRNYSELGGAIPELRLDLHVYAAKPAERYAFINMHKVREGDVTPEGVAVREITPDGVVLEYHGTEFLLGR